METAELARLRSIAIAAKEDSITDLAAHGGRALDRFTETVDPDKVLELIKTIEDLHRDIARVKGGLVSALEIPTKAFKEGSPQERYLPMREFLATVRDAFGVVAPQPYQLAS